MLNENLPLVGVIFASAVAFGTIELFRQKPIRCPTEVNFQAAKYAVFSFLAAFFAFSAFEYFWAYNVKSLTVWEHVFAYVTSSGFAYGAGSVRAEMHDTYQGNYFALQLHASTGSAMLFIGISQFWTPFRAKYPQIHRRLGQLYVLLAVPTCLGAVAYLASATPSGVFSGPVFFVSLAGLAGATAFSTLMAYRTALQQNFEAHRAWMLLSYFCILSAPILRAAWIIIYQFTNDLNHWDNNLYAQAPSIAVIAIGPLIFLGVAARRRLHDK